MRVLYPYDLEWMEGGMLIHGLRVMNGEGIYVQPSSDFIPFIYPPFYSWILGIAGWMGHLDYAMGRSISLVTTLIAGAALIRSMRFEGASWGMSFASAAIFLSLYNETGSFYDLVRADGCLIALLSWSMLSVRQNKPILGGLLLWVAFLTKHNAAIFGVPALWWLWTTKRRSSAIRFSVSSIVPALISIVLLQWHTNGYFLTYLLGVPAKHPFVTQRFMWLSFKELIDGVWLGALLAGLSSLSWLYSKYGWRSIVFKLALIGFVISIGAYLYLSFTRPIPTILNWHRDVTICIVAAIMWLGVCAYTVPLWNLSRTEGQRFWFWTGGLALLFSAIMRGHHGGYMNVLIPGGWFLSLWMGLLWQYWADRVQPNINLGLTALMCLMLWNGKWELERYAPSENDYKAGEKLISKLKEIEGPIFAPHFPWYPVMAGHPPTTHLISLWDIDHEGGVLYDDVQKIKADIHNYRFNAVLAPSSRYDYGVMKKYTVRESLRLPGHGLMPKTGWRVRPSLLMFPKGSTPSETAP
ncbi:MAG: glycosyltransferase family 87 protein [Myxococcota bacterium]|nr:glycosyltransferase family 87 protein [Myxococcota bacterium]